MRRNLTTSTNLVLLLIVMETFQNDLSFSSNHKSSLKITNECVGFRLFHWDKMSVTFLIKILFCDFILDYGVETDQVENEIAERSSAPEIIQR